MDDKTVALLRGQLYNSEKKEPTDGGKGTAKATEVHSDPRLTTAEKVAKQTGVSAATVKRDAKLATAAEEIGITADIEDYCRVRWGMSRPRAYQLIESASTVSTIVDKGHLPPATESQARPLSALPPEDRAEAWQEAVTSAFTGPPTARSRTTAGSGGGLPATTQTR